MVAVDTNILIRLAVKDVPPQTKQAHAMLQAARPRSLLLDRVTLAETIYVLKTNYRLEREQIIRAINVFLRDKRFRLEDRELLMTMWEIYKTANLSPEDACLAATVALGRATDVHTFDQGLKKCIRNFKK